MIVLSYGFENPQSGDPGSIWFAALNNNIVQLNNHTHDGVTSAPLAPGSTVAAKLTIPASGWTGSAGNYSQSLNVPLGVDMRADYSITCYDANNNICYPTINANGSANYITIYSPDNTFSYTLVFR